MPRMIQIALQANPEDVLGHLVRFDHVLSEAPGHALRMIHQNEVYVWTRGEELEHTEQTFCLYAVVLTAEPKILSPRQRGDSREVAIHAEILWIAETTQPGFDGRSRLYQLPAPVPRIVIGNDNFEITAIA